MTKYAGGAGFATNINPSALAQVVTLLCIRKFRRSDLDVLPAVIVQLIARTIWNMQPVVNPQQLKTPPRFRFFD